MKHNKLNKQSKINAAPTYKKDLLIHILFLIVVSLFSQRTLSSECTMQPAQINIKRIAQNPAVKSYVIDDGKLSLTVLLKNGRAVRLVHSGCEHSGATASLWLDVDTPLSNTDAWLKEANILAGIAFSPDITNDILNSIKSRNFEKKMSDSRVVISASPSSFMSYSIVISKTEHGLLLTIIYVLG